MAVVKLSSIADLAKSEYYGIEIDSRKVKAGDVFFAFKGQNTDGHNYVVDACNKGAVAVVVEEYRPQYQDLPVIIVPSSMRALEELALVRRQNYQGNVIAVTGSMGKTTTKEMLKHSLSSIGKTYGTEGNYNNHLGVPICMSRAPVDAKYVVLEMGMNHANEIDQLSAMARPDIGIITTVESVHLENFASIEGIADAKCEIFSGLNPKGFAILNKSNRYFDYLRTRASQKYGVKNFVSFGEHEDADVRLLEAVSEFGSTTITANVFGKKISYSINLLGKHQAINSLIVASVAHIFGINEMELVSSLFNFNAVRGRGAFIKIRMGDKDITLIDDSYNAHPVSMAAAINMFSSIKVNGRKIAILGDMLELGSEEQALHIAMADNIVNSNLDSVILVGKFMKEVANKLPKAKLIDHFNKYEDLSQKLALLVQNNDTILVKSSYGTGLHKLVAELTK